MFPGSFSAVIAVGARGVFVFTGCSIVDALSPELIKLLANVKAKAGFPLRITSGFRPGDPRSHGQGEAVDIACETSNERFRLVSAALEAGCVRIGIYPKHVHLDTSKTRATKVLWLDGHGSIYYTK